MVAITPEKKLEIIKKVKDLAQKKFQTAIVQQDEKAADDKLTELNKL